MTPAQVVANKDNMTKDELWEYVLLFPVQHPEDGDDPTWFIEKYGDDYNAQARAISKAWRNAS